MLQYDKMIDISIGSNRHSMNWQSAQMLVSGFYEKLRLPIRSKETLAEYMAMETAQQDDLKDVGGFIGGTLNSPRRKSSNVSNRILITLDADNTPAGKTDEIKLRVAGLGCSAVIYSTRKHHGAAPRLRIITPLDRAITADEYEPCARKLAQLIDPTMAMFDRSTFEVARLMYWPSCCADGEYVFEIFDKPFVSADGLLAQYSDWRDVSLWPSLPGAKVFAQKAVKQGDPEGKAGVVGAFCRTYDVYRAVDELLPGIYEPVDNAPDRYTYIGGSTTGGAVVYDNGKFLYSHHATDPCGGLLVNAFDLVRLHRFADLDDEATPGTRGNRLPSYMKMIETAMADKEVSAVVAKERLGAIDDFKDIAGANLNWAALLQVGSQGGYQKSLQNYALVLQNHPCLNGCVRLNAFNSRKIAVEELPWPRLSEDKNGWSDADTTELCIWMERIFGKVSRLDIRNAINAVAQRQSFHPVRDYLAGLVWDGIPRLDTLYIDYFGAEDSEYTRAVTRKSIIAAVARVETPGCKYDYMPVLIGKQGSKKSIFFDILAGGTEYFSDSLKTFEGQKAQEGVQGKWIIEIAEMQTLDKTNVNAAKGFMTQRSDYFRPAYGEESRDYPRQCAFFGTSNNYECLRDDTGGRRFWPITADQQPRKKDVTADLPGERDQIWAEAVVRWRQGETLFLPDELEAVAAQTQEEHREIHPWEHTIRDFVEREIPSDWSTWDLNKRTMFWNGNVVDGVKLVERSRICIREIWQEALGKDLASLNAAHSRIIGSVLTKLEGWERAGLMRFGKAYGHQKGFKRTIAHITSNWGVNQHGDEA